VIDRGSQLAESTPPIRRKKCGDDDALYRPRMQDIVAACPMAEISLKLKHWAVGPLAA